MATERCRTVSRLIVLLIVGLSIVPRASQAAPVHRCDLVILADPTDPFYLLAEEIAAAENAPLASGVLEALACSPDVLLWIVSPEFLSDAAMIAYGQAVKTHGSAVSSGIITGSTLEQARDLWKRRSQVAAQTMVAVNAPNPAAHIDTGHVVVISHGKTEAHTLTPESLIRALQTADYLTFTGHGGNGYLRLDDETKVLTRDIPSLDSVVVSTGSCQTFRPWNSDSIARRFTDQGAASYAGFVHSPNEGYLIGEFADLPYRYTWPDFPIGHIVQVQVRGTQQGFARIPYLFLLGDPRIAFQAAPPYRLVEDRDEGNRRTLILKDVPAGAIPIRIAGGADYRFVRVPGLTASADGDPFYNSKLQMVTMGEDRLILLIHPGGELTLQLRRRAPLLWHPVDMLLDSLDHTFVYSQQTGGDAVVSGVAVLALLWTSWQGLKRRLSWREVRLSLLAGVAAAALQASYVLLRLNQVTITSKAVTFSHLSIIATFTVVGGGVLMGLRARRRIGEAVAVLVATAAGWLPVVGGLLVLGAWNALASRPRLGTAIYNYRLGLIPLPAFTLMAAITIITIRVGRKSLR